jgi:hypothetical protein
MDPIQDHVFPCTQGSLSQRVAATDRWPRWEVRLRIAIYAVGLGALAIYFVNNILGSIDFSANYWTFPRLIPTQVPPGSDFYVGVYRPSLEFRHGYSPYEIPNAYPPFMVVWGIPFTFFSPSTAYVIQILGLLFANAAVLWLTFRLASDAFQPIGAPPAKGDAAFILTLMVGFVHLTSYGMLFSLERGNYDIYPILLGLGALWLMIHRPGWLWPQMLLLSIAAHMKIYPAILFLLVLYLHRWRAILPAAVCNTGLLLLLGWKRVFEFLHWVKSNNEFCRYMPINHSMNSFAATVLVPHWGLSPETARRFVLVPLLIWALGAIVLLRRQPFSPANALLLFALSIPPMELVPNVSYDYKLVMCSVPLGVLLYGCVMRFAADGSKRAALIACLLLVLAANLSRSYVVTLKYPWLTSKCPTILVLELLVLLAVLVPGIVQPTPPAGGSGFRGLPDYRSK